MTEDAGPTQHPDLVEDELFDEPRPGPSAPPRRGPARPPRRYTPAGSNRPRRVPGRPGAVPAEPTSGQVPAVIAGGPVHDDHDYVDLPHEGSIPRWLGVIIVLFLIVGVVIGAGWWWYNRQVNPPGSPGQTVTVEIPQGSSTSGIGSILEGEGIIPNAMIFNFYVSRKQAGPFEAGIYRLKENSDLDLVIETMSKGPKAPIASKTAKVSIPEGLTVAELVTKAADQVPRFTEARLQAALDDGAVTSSLRPDGQPSYEGLLFPATYEVGSSKSEKEFLDVLAAEMESRLAGLDVDAAKARIKSRYGLDLSTYELLTVASMVQAEAGNPDEAPKIATVIYNRLQQGIALGIDAADNYGADLAGVEVDYEDTSAPYNTRRNVGLPPTPIAAPGDFALGAALNPAVGPWRYYVLTDPNVHTFAETQAEFDRAKQICVQKGLGCG